MSVIPAEHLITCNRCDVSGSVAGPIFERIKHQIPEAELARLEQGLKTGQYEVSLVLAPGFEYLPENYGIERRYHRKRGTYQPVYEFNEFTGQLSSMILRADGNEPPRAPDTFWALQVLDRSEQKKDQKRGHYAVVFCGNLEDQARWLDLTFSDEERLSMSISDIGEVGSYLFEWVDRFGLFKTIDYPPLRRRKGSRRTGNGTTTALFHRFLEAACSTPIDPVEQLCSGEREMQEVHHIDGHPLHNCWDNRKCLRRSVHAGLTAAEAVCKSSCKTKGSSVNPSLPLSTPERPIQGGHSKGKKSAFRLRTGFDDAFLSACAKNAIIDAVHIAKRLRKSPASALSPWEKKIAKQNGFLPDEYAQALKRRAGRPKKKVISKNKEAYHG